MMNIVSSPGVSGFMWLWMIHSIAVLLSTAGLLILFVWVVKTFNHHQLKSWGLSLLVTGILLCLFTTVVKGGPWIGGKYGMMGGKMMVVDKEMMMDMDEMMKDYPARTNDAAFNEMRTMMEEMMKKDAMMR